MTSSIGHPSTEIEYPDTDGLPMAESDFQRQYLSYAVEVLRIYQPMPTTVLSDGSRVLMSEVLALELRLQADSLRFYNPVSGEKLLTHQESEQARTEAERALQEAVLRLLELGLSVEQVAGALSLSVQQVRQATQE